MRWKLLMNFQIITLIHINTLLIPLILCALNSIKSTSNIDVVVFTTVVEQGKIFFFRPQFHQVSI